VDGAPAAVYWRAGRPLLDVDLTAGRRIRLVGAEVAPGEAVVDRGAAV
jgi:hypothetical protein